MNSDEQTFVRDPGIFLLSHGEHFIKIHKDLKNAEEENQNIDLGSILFGN